MARRPSQDRQQMHGQMYQGHQGQVYNNGQMYTPQPQVYGQPMYYSTGYVQPHPTHPMQTYYRPTADGTAAMPSFNVPPPAHVPQLIGQQHYVPQGQVMNPIMSNAVQMYPMQMVPAQNQPMQFPKPYMVPTTTHMEQLTDQLSLTSLDTHQPLQQHPPVPVEMQPPPPITQFQTEPPVVQSPQPAEKAPTPLNSLNTNHDSRQKQPSPLANGQKEFVNQSFATNQSSDWQQHIRTDAERDRRHRDNVSRSSQGSTMQRPRHDRRSPPQRTQDVRRQQPPPTAAQNNQSWRARDMPPPAPAPVPKQPARPYLKECTYCMNLGKAFNECCTHTVVDPVTHAVQCPELRKTICSECGATGEQAHDSHFCPQQAENRSKKRADMEKVARQVKHQLTVRKAVPPPRSLAATQVGEPMRKHSQQSSGGGGGTARRHHGGDRGHHGGYPPSRRH